MKVEMNAIQVLELIRLSLMNGNVPNAIKIIDEVLEQLKKA